MARRPFLDEEIVVVVINSKCFTVIDQMTPQCLSNLLVAFRERSDVRLWRFLPNLVLVGIAID